MGTVISVELNISASLCWVTTVIKMLSCHKLIEMLSSHTGRFMIAKVDDKTTSNTAPSKRRNDNNIIQK